MKQDMGYTVNGECMCGKTAPDATDEQRTDMWRGRTGEMQNGMTMQQNGVQNGTIMQQNGVRNGMMGQPGMTMIGADNVDQNTMQQNLAGMIGKYVIIEMLIGTSEMVLRHGFLTKVGNSYFEIYNPETKAYIMGDLYTIKFVSYLRGGERPDTASFAMWSRAYDEFGRQQYLNGNRRTMQYDFLPAIY